MAQRGSRHVREPKCLSRGDRKQKNNQESDGSDLADDDHYHEATNACVRFIVSREGNKVPIKRTEFVKHLTSTYHLPNSKVGSVLSEANQLLKRVYGYKLVQVEGKGGTQYIVALSQESDGVPCPVLPESPKIILNAALTHIFMSGGTVREEDMWKFLMKANLMEEHDQNIKKLLTQTFVKQMYLTHTKEGEGELARLTFQWGQRASEETTKMFLLQKVAQAMEKTPAYWAEQNRIAQEEQQDFQAN